MSTSRTLKNEWGDCAQGEINQMVQRLKARRFLSMVRRDATLLTALMVALFSGYFYFGVLPETKMDLGDINCLQVQPLAEEFLTGQLDPQTRQKVQQHLRYCEFCRKHVEDVRSEALNHGREGEGHHKWESVRSAEIVAMRELAEQLVP